MMQRTVYPKTGAHFSVVRWDAQAVVDADGSQLVPGTDVYATPNDRHGFEALVDHLCKTVGTPDTLLADSGYAGETVVEALEARNIEPLIAVSRGQQERPYDFRPPPDRLKRPKAITAPWRLSMIEKLQTDEAKRKYRKRKSTVEPVFGIIKSVLGFTRFQMRGIEKVKAEWQIVTLAYNLKRLTKMRMA